MKTRPRTSLSNRAENAFAARLEAEGKLWFHQPKTFVLPPPHYSYRPDFYVVDDGCFYEVVGTRQAYSYKRRAVDAFRSIYPKLRIEVVNNGAWIVGPQRARKKKVKRAQSLRPRGQSSAIRNARLRNLNGAGQEILRLIDEHGIQTLSQFSIKTVVSLQRINEILYGRSSGKIVLPRILAAFNGERTN